MSESEVVRELSRSAFNPKEPRLVDDLIARARKRPDGIELLRDGYLGSVAIIYGVHAFTVEAARARLQSES